MATDEHAGAGSAPAANRQGLRWRSVLGALIAIGALLVGVAGVTAGLVGRATPGVSAQPFPTDTSADAGFSRDMQVHHAQAVEMAMVIRDRTDDEDIRLLAYDIALTQQEQIGEMHGLLIGWGLSQTSSEPDMAWMGAGGHSHGTPADGTPADGGAPSPTMPGMASAADMKRLAALSGTDAEVLFLQLMIAHHRGGVEMAAAGAALAGTSQVRDFAAGMAKTQRSEIDLMNNMLRDRGAPQA